MSSNTNYRELFTRLVEVCSDTFLQVILNDIHLERVDKDELKECMLWFKSLDADDLVKLKYEVLEKSEKGLTIENIKTWVGFTNRNLVNKCQDFELYFENMHDVIAIVLSFMERNDITTEQTEYYKKSLSKYISTISDEVDLYVLTSHSAATPLYSTESYLKIGERLLPKMIKHMDFIFDQFFSPAQVKRRIYEIEPYKSVSDAEKQFYDTLDMKPKDRFMAILLKQKLEIESINTEIEF